MVLAAPEIAEPPAPQQAPPPVGPYRVEIFFDGDCPLCEKEISAIRWMDRRERVRFTDIAQEGFDPAAYGKDMPTLMAEIHGRDARGEWLIGVEVFRQVYAAIGFGPVVALTRLPGVRQLLDLGYGFFAKRRLWLTGRCHDGACRVS